jgi:hypothetical protein
MASDRSIDKLIERFTAWGTRTPNIRLVAVIGMHSVRSGATVVGLAHVGGIGGGVFLLSLGRKMRISSQGG